MRSQMRLYFWLQLPGRSKRQTEMVALGSLLDPPLRELARELEVLVGLGLVAAHLAQFGEGA